jgi:hypothetical protein
MFVPDLLMVPALSDTCVEHEVWQNSHGMEEKRDMQSTHVCGNEKENVALHSTDMKRSCVRGRSREDTRSGLGNEKIRKR